MPIFYHAFCVLPFKEQLPLVWMEGSLLAQRWEEQDTMGLYHMDGGFFCELTYNQELNAVSEIYPFLDTDWLEHYTCSIDLNDLINSAE